MIAEKAYLIRQGRSSRELFVISKGLKKVVDGNCFINNKLLIENNSKLDFKLENEDVYNNYIINNYAKIIDDGFSIREFKINDTTKFILPLLFNSKENLLYNFNLINGYVNYYKYKNESLGELIHVVFRYVPFEYYDKYLNYLKEIKNNTFEFIDINKSIDGRFDIISFKINDVNVKNDIISIIEGYPNLITEINKMKILNFHNAKNDSLLAGMLFNTEQYLQHKCEKFGIKISDLPKDFVYRTKPLIEDESWL